MQILDGKQLASKIKDDLKRQIEQYSNKRPPHLAAILVGNNGASETYVSSKIKVCSEVGFQSSLIQLDENISQEELLRHIHQLNQDDAIDGILVQLPLPAHIHENEILQAVAPEKDVDGFHPINAGLLMQGTPRFIPATPYGIMLMLDHYQIETSGKHAVVIGRSNIVGRPISVLLNQNTNPGNCTVTVCHSRSAQMTELCKQADIIVAAIGKANFVKKEMLKPGAVVIDVGINRIPDATRKTGYRILGDVDYEDVTGVCSAITPVPGGVGPMTIAALLKNTMKAYELR